MNSLISCFAIEFATPEMDEALALRNKVLRIPLGLEFLPEDIASEWNSHHLVASFESGEIVGVLILKPGKDQVAKMRQVAIDPGVQKTGIGKKLVDFSENFAKSIGYSKVELHARAEAVPFYQSLNYLIKGEKFTEVGIDHYFMYKILD